MHAKRVLSVANATLGVIHAALLAVSTRFDVWELFSSWVPMVVAERTEATVVLDWTDFDKDDLVFRGAPDEALSAENEHAG